MTKNIPATKARQGLRGRPILMILIVSLALVGVVWAIVEYYGRSIEPASQSGQVSQTEMSNSLQTSVATVDRR